MSFTASVPSLANRVLGIYLSHLARREPAIYSVATVETGVCKMLYEQAALMGFKRICLGKCSNNTINLDMTDDMCRDEAHESSPQQILICRHKEYKQIHKQTILIVLLLASYFYS